MKLSPFLIALYVGVAALMFQLHSAAKRELNEDDSLQLSLLGVIDRERGSAFKALLAAVNIRGLIQTVTEMDGSDPSWEVTMEECEASLYELAVKLYIPLSRCAAIRSARSDHVTFLKMCKVATLASLVAGVISAILLALAAGTGFDQINWITVGTSIIFFVGIVFSIILWYRADSRQSMLADIRRVAGRRL